MLLKTHHPLINLLGLFLQCFLFKKKKHKTNQPTSKPEQTDSVRPGYKNNKSYCIKKLFLKCLNQRSYVFDKIRRHLQCWPQKMRRLWTGSSSQRRTEKTVETRMFFRACSNLWFRKWISLTSLTELTTVQNTLLR